MPRSTATSSKSYSVVERTWLLLYCRGLATFTGESETELMGEKLYQFQLFFKLKLISLRLKLSSFSIARFCVHQKVEEGQTHFRVEAYLWKPLSPITDAALSVVTKMFWVVLFKYFSLFNLSGCNKDVLGFTSMYILFFVQPVESIVCHDRGRPGARARGRAIRLSGRRLQQVFPDLFFL